MIIESLRSSFTIGLLIWLGPNWLVIYYISTLDKEDIVKTSSHLDFRSLNCVGLWLNSLTEYQTNYD